MSDYHLVDASTGEGISAFSTWSEAHGAWLKIRDKRSVKLLLVRPCGCLRRCIRVYREGNRWRTIEFCQRHERLLDTHGEPPHVEHIPGSEIDL